MAVGTRCADHVTPLYLQKLALTSPTGGGRSVGIVRVRTKAMEFSLVKSWSIWHLKDQGVAGYCNFPGIRTLHIMGIFVYLATLQIDLTT